MLANHKFIKQISKSIKETALETALRKQPNNIVVINEQLTPMLKASLTLV